MRKRQSLNILEFPLLYDNVLEYYTIMACLALAPEDYTVAWICALPVELAAAQNMLNKEYKGVFPAASNHNSYILDCIYSHNIVIANLPFDIYGTIVATTVLV